MKGYWKEFDIYIKFPDDELMGTTGDFKKVKASIDITKVCGFYESIHAPTGTHGTGLDIAGCENTFICLEYEEFKEIMDNAK